MESKRTFFGLHIDDKSTPKKLLVMVIGLWAASAIVIYFIGKNDGEWSTRGQIGDMFGAINALFSGLAFAGIIYTILLQREELSEQRHELELTRQEFETQNKTLKLQRFEATFFNLLDLHNRLIEEFEFDETKELFMKRGKVYRGRDIFEYFTDNLFKDLQHFGQLNQEAFHMMKERYHKHFRFLGTEIDLYLKSLHRMLRYVEDHIFDDLESKNFYKSIISSSLSEDEKCMIYYHLSLGKRDEIELRLLSIEGRTKMFSTMHPWLFNDAHAEFPKMWIMKHSI
jgi:hypothetical protein